MQPFLTPARDLGPRRMTFSGSSPPKKEAAIKAAPGVDNVARAYAPAIHFRISPVTYARPVPVA